MQKVRVSPSLAALVTWVVCLPAAFGAAVLGTVDAEEPAISFTPAQFSPDAFTVFTNLPGNLVLAVRQPQRDS